MNKGIRFCWECKAREEGFTDAKSFLESFAGRPNREVAESFGITTVGWCQVKKRFGVKLGQHGGPRVKNHQ